MKIQTLKSRIGKNGEPLEIAVQLSILRYLKFRGFTAGKVRTMGVKRGKAFCFDPYTFVGYPDLSAFGIIGGKFRFMFIEVKAAKGVQSDRQKAFQALCEQAGVIYILARSVEDVKKVVEV